MKTSTVIKALQKQLNTLDDDKLDFNSMWTENTGTWLKMAFDDHDELLRKYSQICTTFSIEKSPPHPNSILPADYKRTPLDDLVRITKEAFKPILRSAIERIKITGIKRPPEGNNILSKMSNGTLLGIALFALPLIGGLGTLWGKYLSDTQNIELKIQVKNLQDSLSNLRTVPVINNPNTKAADSGNKNSSTKN